MSSISLYKLDPDKLTTPFESAHQFTLVCTVSDSKTVPGCHYNLRSKYITLFRAVFSLPGHSLPLLYTDLRHFSSFGDLSASLTAALEFECECFLSSRHHSKFSLTHAQQVHNIKKTTYYMTWLLSISWSRHKLNSFDYLLAVWLFSMLLLSSKGKFHADSSATCL